MGDPESLDVRLARHLEELGAPGAGERVLVAVSGGCDSVALLHLLRFSEAGRGLALHAAHFDHAMRPESGRDAAWVRGVCRAWGVPLLEERAREALRGEAAARQARYRFLRRAAGECGAEWIATAHQADDQAETVLFRVLRGTGLRGLRGIDAVHPSGLLRPLLPFWREEVEAYARRAGLRWRNDPTNLSLQPARNRLRRQVLPLVERTVAPGARRSLVRLAELARAAEAGWEILEERVMEEGVRVEDGAVVLAAGNFRKYDSALAARVLRRVLRRFGTVLDRAGTRAALQFITSARSGRRLLLPGGVLLTAEFETVRVEPAPAGDAEDRPLTIPGTGPGEGEAVIGGVRYGASWGGGGGVPADGSGGEGRLRVALDPEALRFPLVLRGWRPGDRIRTSGGTKRLKKVFGERRIGRTARARIPVLVDARGVLVWVAGLARAPDAAPHSAQDALFISIDDDRSGKGS